MKKLITIVGLIATFLSGCSNTGESDKMNKNDTNTYTLISASEAKEIMDSEEDIVILDVREKNEYKEGHIENAVLLPLGDIEFDAEDVLTDKDQRILVYCRSGRRSQMASQELVELGYTNVYDFGGVLDWEYELVK